MTKELSELIDRYSAYFSGSISIEQLKGWISDQMHNKWKSDWPIIELDLQFDRETFPNPETELHYRLLNLEAARQINTYVAVANTAFSASKVAVYQLKDYQTGLSLMLESLQASIEFAPLNSIMMTFRNVGKFYTQGITDINAWYLKESYHKLLAVTCAIASRVPDGVKLLEIADITVDALQYLLEYKTDKDLAKQTVTEMEKSVLPFILKKDKPGLMLRLGDLLG
jgi:hypothetical protein